MELTPQASLLSWYEHNGRHDLPWRNTDDPYAIYLSEIMLQQTQVKTVLERFCGKGLDTTRGPKIFTMPHVNAEVFSQQMRMI
jgi:hypothetical protein